MPNEADKELDEILFCYKHEGFSDEWIVTKDTKVQLLAWRDRAVRAELEATYKAELRQAVEKVYEADND